MLGWTSLSSFPWQRSEWQWERMTRWVCSSL
jgi:hypothetical protein